MPSFAAVRNPPLSEAPAESLRNCFGISDSSMFCGASMVPQAFAVSQYRHLYSVISIVC